MKTIKQTFVLLFLLFQAFTSNGQKEPPVHYCGSDALRLQLEKSDPTIKEKDQENDEYIKKQILNSESGMKSGEKSLRTVPVVVHIIHNGGAENISDAQVLRGIQHLNDAFANVGVFDQGTGTDVEIRFCLATQNPDGDFSTGINRVQSTLTDMSVDTDDLLLKNLIRWDPTRYINIWLVREIRANGGDPAGYATLPSSHGGTRDGIVNEARWFGSNTDDSKIHVHEMGHYFNLYHTFEGGCLNFDCLSSGDKVCDTPPDLILAPGDCPSPHPNSCNTDENDYNTYNPFRSTIYGGIGDQPDMINNYMDYSGLSCTNAFTPGQAARMNAALSGPRASLLNSLGCQPHCQNPITASFSASAINITAGQTVNFTNSSSGATSYEWLENNAIYSTTFSSSRTFNTQGTYNITLVARNGEASCTKRFTRTITVTCPLNATFTTSTTNPSLGNTVTFTNTTTGAISSQWLIDGAPSSSSLNLSYTFNRPGGYSFQLIAYNGACYDTSRVEFINIETCANNKTGNIWYFGDKVGLNFNSGSPVALDNSQMYAMEGASTISDENGNLLFYTNGLDVFNRLHQVMPNGSGLKGGLSSTQSSLIIPFPGNCKKYYIFTTTTLEEARPIKGFYYNVVDMNEDGGLGNVTIKNVLLHQPCTEKLTGTYHSNGIDFWVVTHDDKTDAFLAYLVTSAGVSTTPVISNIGDPFIYNSIYGGMRISKSGKKLACTDSGHQQEHVGLYDFNNTTGVVSNYIKISQPPVFGQTPVKPYGVEFSPDNSKLYVSSANGYLAQYNLSLGTAQRIINSRVLFPYFAVAYGRTLALGPDGKIYVGNNSNKISVIHSPNIAGTGCNLQLETITFVRNVELGLNNYLPACNSCCPTATVSITSDPTAYLLGDHTYTITVRNTSANPINGLTITAINNGVSNITLNSISPATPATIAAGATGTFTVRGTFSRLASNFNQCFRVRSADNCIDATVCRPTSVVMGCPVSWSTERINCNQTPFTGITRTLGLSLHNSIPNVTSLNFCVDYDPALVRPTASPFTNLPAGATLSNVVNSGTGRLSARINFSSKVDFVTSDGDGDPVLHDAISATFNVLAKPANSCAININSCEATFVSTTLGTLTRPVDYGRIVFQGEDCGCPPINADFSVSSATVWPGQTVTMSAVNTEGVHFWRVGENNNQLLGNVTWRASYIYNNPGTYTITHQIDDLGFVNFASRTVSVCGITCGPVPTNICAGSSVVVPVNITPCGTFNAGNIFTAQLSDASGSFANPVSIGTLSSTTAGNINAQIPANTAAGANYRIRVIASSPAGLSTTLIGSDNGTNISVSSQCGALSFDGGDRVVIPHNAAYNFGTGNFTMEAWVNLPYTTGNRPIISKRLTGANGGSFMFMVYGGTRLLLQINSYNFLSTTFPNIYDGNCHHIAVTREGTTLSFYLDGVLRGTSTSSGSISSANPINLFYDHTDNRHTTGTLDEVRLWNLARTETQLASQRSVHIPGNTPGLVGYWDMNEGAGQVVYDVSSTANNGSLGTNSSAVDTGDPARVNTRCFVPELKMGLTFDGIDDRATIPHNAAFDFGTGAFSFETWITLGLQSKTTMPVITKNAVGSHAGFALRIANSGAGIWVAINGSGVITSVPNLFDGKCHHIAVTRSATGSLKIYLDGNLRTTYPLAHNMNTAAPFSFGFEANNGNTFVGSINEVRIWNNERTASELNSFKGVVLPASSNLVGYYKLKEPSGQVVEDAGSLANNGFLGNNALQSDIADPIRHTNSCFSGDRKASGPFDPETAEPQTEDVQIYPNPFTTNFTFNVKGGEEEMVMVKIIDLQGNTVAAYEAICNQNHLVGEKLSTGVYLVQIIKNNKPLSYKIIKL